VEKVFNEIFSLDFVMDNRRSVDISEEGKLFSMCITYSSFYFYFFLSFFADLKILRAVSD